MRRRPIEPCSSTRRRDGVRLVMVTTGGGASIGFALGEEVVGDLFGGGQS